MNNTYEETGILSNDNLMMPTEKQFEKGVAITECIQDIPCNPCVDSCPVHAISMKDINAPPVVDYDTCIACGNCVGVCPGLAIFVVKKLDTTAEITLPYEFIPVPNKNQKVNAHDRKGTIVDTGIVKQVRKKGRTYIVTIEIQKKYAMDIRHISVKN